MNILVHLDRDIRPEGVVEGGGTRQRRGTKRKSQRSMQDRDNVSRFCVPFLCAVPCVCSWRPFSRPFFSHSFSSFSTPIQVVKSSFATFFAFPYYGANNCRWKEAKKRVTGHHGFLALLCSLLACMFFCVAKDGGGGVPGLVIHTRDSPSDTFGSRVGGSPDAKFRRTDFLLPFAPFSILL